MSTWICDRLPENNHNVLVSLKWDEEARLGFYSQPSGIWRVWVNDEVEMYDRTDVDGWLPLPKTVYDSAAEFAKARGAP